MYIPESFRIEDLSEILKFVKQNAFATIVTVSDGVPMANHIPLMLKRNDESVKLLGHMARANEQWQHFSNEDEVLVIFHGPHSYVSPSNYDKNSKLIPTWNYAVVHMYGKAKVVDSKETSDIIESLTNLYENARPNPVEPVYPERIVDMIVGFEVDVTRIEAKYKLSQNRSENERKNIVIDLKQSGKDVERALANLMEATL